MPAQFLECILSRETCLLPLSAIEEVIPSPSYYTLLPSSPGWMVGLAVWRGEVMAVVDLESYLGDTESETRHPNGATDPTRATARVAPTLHETDAAQFVVQGRGDPRGRPGTSALLLTPMDGTHALLLTPMRCPPGGVLLCTHYMDLAIGLYVPAIEWHVTQEEEALDGEILLAGIAHQIGMVAQDV